MIWEDSYLDSLAREAENEINANVPCIYHRFFLAITAGLSVYTLPEKVKSVTKILWKGEILQEVAYSDLLSLTPNTYFVDSGNRNEGTLGRPRFWAKHPTSIRDIRFFPTPSETISDIEDINNNPYEPNKTNRCIVACWRTVDESNPLPPFVLRQVKKAYVLWRAFSKEGKGQNLIAADYYKARWDELIQIMRSINSGTFVSKKYILGPVQISQTTLRGPSLPSNYERTIY